MILPEKTYERCVNESGAGLRYLHTNLSICIHGPE
jgi:hypothetical protein